MSLSRNDSLQKMNRSEVQDVPYHLFVAHCCGFLMMLEELKSNLLIPATRCFAHDGSGGSGGFVNSILQSFLNSSKGQSRPDFIAGCPWIYLHSKLLKDAPKKNGNSSRQLPSFKGWSILDHPIQSLKSPSINPGTFDLFDGISSLAATLGPLLENSQHKIHAGFLRFATFLHP